MFIERKVPNLQVAIKLASAGFVQPITPALEADVEAHIYGGDFAFTLTEGGQDIGFAIFKKMDNVLYLCGMMIEPRFHGQSYAVDVISAARELCLSQYFALRTQSIKMWKAGFKACRIWAPARDEAILYPQDLEAVAFNVAKQLGMTAPIQAGFYGSALYGEKPVCLDQEKQDWWDRFCDLDRGDAVVCVGIF